MQLNLPGITDLKLFERHGKPVCEKKITEKEVITQILRELRDTAGRL